MCSYIVCSSRVSSHRVCVIIECVVLQCVVLECTCVDFVAIERVAKENLSDLLVVYIFKCEGNTFSSGLCLRWHSDYVEMSPASTPAPG